MIQLLYKIIGLVLLYNEKWDLHCSTVCVIEVGYHFEMFLCSKVQCVHNDIQLN